MSDTANPREVLYRFALEMYHWNDETLELFYDMKAKYARQRLVKICNGLARAERERKLREIEDNLPF